jgi:hypothetical protein
MYVILLFMFYNQNPYVGFKFRNRIQIFFDINYYIELCNIWDEFIIWVYNQHAKYEFATLNTCSIALIFATDILW